MLSPMKDYSLSGLQFELVSHFTYSQSGLCGNGRGNCSGYGLRSKGFTVGEAHCRMGKVIWREQIDTKKQDWL